MLLLFLLCMLLCWWQEYHRFAHAGRRLQEKKNAFRCQKRELFEKAIGVFEDGSDRAVMDFLNDDGYEKLKGYIARSSAVDPVEQKYLYELLTMGEKTIMMPTKKVSILRVRRSAYVQIVLLLQRTFRSVLRTWVPPNASLDYMFGVVNYSVIDEIRRIKNTVVIDVDAEDKVKQEFFEEKARQDEFNLREVGEEDLYGYDDYY